MLRDALVSDIKMKQQYKNDEQKRTGDFVMLKKRCEDDFD